ncbi:MFS family permease [Streptomyces sp. SAI-135]|nr:MFS family permease [Streptomyces sp. SAI-090]MDH6620648.1 MFS family permease [Streptomyces sp. SAI-135]
MPFLLTLPLGLGALWLRLRLDETPAFREETGREEAARERPGAGEDAGAIALGAGRIMGWAAAGHTFLVVLPAYLQSTLNAGFQQALLATLLANLGSAATILPAGLLSDRVGRPVLPVRSAVLLLTSPALPAAAKEAYAFAVLGFPTAHGLPGTEPTSTGARHARVLGSVTPGREGLRLPPPARERPVRLVLE